MRSPFHAALVAALVVTATGCFSPYIKKTPNQPDPNPSSALGAGYVVRFNDGGGQKSLLDAAVDAAQNAGLEEFGKAAQPKVEATLKDHGYTLTFNRERAKTLEAISLRSDATTAAFTGQWVHPDSTYWTPQYVDNLFTKPADFTTKLKVEGQHEYFAFVSIDIFDSGLLFKEPYIIIRTLIADENGKIVAELGGHGKGESSPFVTNRSPQNLERALDAALAEMKSVAVTALP